MESRIIRVETINETWNIVDFLAMDSEKAKDKGTLSLDEMIPPPDVEPVAWDYYPCLLLADGNVKYANRYYKKMPFDEVIFLLSLKNTVGYDGGIKSKD